jgi:membrane-associated phospholipid phosphatase
MKRFVNLRRHEATIVVLATMVFVLVTADVVIGGLLTQVDESVREQLQTHGFTAPGLLTPLGEIGDVGIAVPVVLTAAVISSQLRWQWWPAAYAIGALAVTELLVLLTKAAVGRPGPGIWADRVSYPGYFPAGHTATAMVSVGIVVFLVLVVPTTSRNRDRATLVSVVAGWVAGGAAGVYAVLGDYHWLSDVVGGLTLTTVVLVVTCSAARNHVHAPEPLGHGG